MNRLGWVALTVTLVLVLAGASAASASQVLFKGAIGKAQVQA